MKILKGAENKNSQAAYIAKTSFSNFEIFNGKSLIKEQNLIQKGEDKSGQFEKNCS